MSTEVRELLERIGRLPEPQQAELRQELARQEELQWEKLQAEARATAQRRGIDDAAINRAVESSRWGNDAAK